MPPSECARYRCVPDPSESSLKTRGRPCVRAFLAGKTPVSSVLLSSFYLCSSKARERERARQESVPTFGIRARRGVCRRRRVSPWKEAARCVVVRATSSEAVEDLRGGEEAAVVRQAKPRREVSPWQARRTRRRLLGVILSYSIVVIPKRCS